MALYEEPEDDLPYRDAHNEEDGDNRQPGVVVGLEPEGADADLQPHQGEDVMERYRLLEIFLIKNIKSKKLA